MRTSTPAPCGKRRSLSRDRPQCPTPRCGNRYRSGSARPADEATGRGHAAGILAPRAEGTTATTACRTGPPTLRPIVAAAQEAKDAGEHHAGGDGLASEAGDRWQAHLHAGGVAGCQASDPTTARHAAAAAGGSSIAIDGVRGRELRRAAARPPPRALDAATIAAATGSADATSTRSSKGRATTTTTAVRAHQSG